MSNHQRSLYAKEIRKDLTRTTAREANPNARHKHCTVFACDKPTQAFAGKGWSQAYCTSHVRHLARNGSAHRSSFRLAELKAYLWAAQRWLKENANDSLVKRIELAFQALLNGDGKAPEIATRMIRTGAKRKAKNAIARMRVRGVKPSRLMVIVLATHAILKDDQSFSHRGNELLEFLHVQIARQAHRLAARFVPKGYEAKVHDGLKWGFKSFPHSAGLVLRELGYQLNEIGGHLVDKALPRILELKVERWGHHPSRQAFEDARLSVAS
jgi:hypothetical protein